MAGEPTAAGAGSLRLVGLVAQARDRLADQARDVHLRDADALRRSPTA